MARSKTPWRVRPCTGQHQKGWAKTQSSTGAATTTLLKLPQKPYAASHLPWFVDLGVGDSEAERLRRDIRVPVKRPLEASEALERLPRIEPPRRGASPMCSEEARIMVEKATTKPGRAGEAGEGAPAPKIPRDKVVS